MANATKADFLLFIMNYSPLFFGTHTALVTPMTKEEALDFVSLKTLINAQIQGNVQGILFAGTTGEAPTLSDLEYSKLLEKGLEFNNKKLLSIVGVGTNNTSKSLQLTKIAQKAGVDAIQIVSPYYNKPSQEGLFSYFSSIAESTQKPIMLYCIPGRCHVEIGISLLERLCSRYPHIASIKVSTHNPDKISTIYKTFGDRLTILSGDDSMTLPFMAVGAKGVVSVISNLFPKKTSKMVQLALQNDFASARNLHTQYHTLACQMLSLDTNPVPIKYALSYAKIIENDTVRSPMASLDKEKKSLIHTLLENTPSDCTQCH